MVMDHRGIEPPVLPTIHGGEPGFPADTSSIIYASLLHDLEDFLARARN